MSGTHVKPDRVLSKPSANVVVLLPRLHRPDATAAAIDAVPERFTARHETEHGRGWLAVAMAAAMHALVVTVLVSNQANETQSGGGQHLEAVSVELVTSRVLESASDQRAADGGDSSASPLEQGQPKPEQEATKPETVSEQSTDAPPIEKPIQPAIPASTAPPETATRALVAAPGMGAAAASAGEVNRYAMQVRAALARGKPRGERATGSVTIVFGIAKDGRVRFARVSAASGSASLEATVLAAVQRTRFPPPPAAMTEDQRTYTIPFHFR